MKALVMREYNRLQYDDVPDPSIGADDVLVKVDACGICGSDIHGLDGSTGRRIPPIIMGHEAAGVIVEVGSNVTKWQPDDRVTFDSTIYCGQCYYCRRGLINLCDNRRVLGVSCDEYRQNGAFAEFVALPQHILYRLPHGIAPEQATMVEALAIAIHAVGRVPVALNDTAVVVGAGMIGLLVVQALRLAGCGQIIAVDLDQDRLALARRLGADQALKGDSADVIAEVLASTGGRGSDVAFEVVGISPTLQLAAGTLRRGGSLGLIGNVSPTAELPLQAVVTRQLTLYGSCSSCGEYPTCLNLIAKGKIDVSAMISAIAPLSEGAIWFERLYRRETGLMKVVLTP